MSTPLRTRSGAVASARVGAAATRGQPRRDHMDRSNCWELKKCGREPGGEKAPELGVCPAATMQALHGVHGGTNSGRTCWAVVGTLCGGTVQGTFAMKSQHCEVCNFYAQVKAEEGRDFVLSPLLLRRLRSTRSP